MEIVKYCTRAVYFENVPNAHVHYPRAPLCTFHHLGYHYCVPFDFDHKILYMSIHTIWISFLVTLIAIATFHFTQTTR